MERLEQRLMEIDGTTIETFHGGSGEPVVCQSHLFSVLSAEPLDPSFGGAMDWNPTLGRVVRVNPRGVGGSSPEWQPDDVTFRRHLDDLEAVRRQVGVNQWVFWGQSGGGCIGLLYALQYPEALRGLIIQTMSASGRAVAEDARSVLSPRHAEVQPYFPVRTHGSLPARRPAVLAGLESALTAAEWMHVGTDDEGELWALMHGSQALVIDGGEARMWAAFEQFVTVFDVQKRLPEIQIPTLIVAGAQDPVIPLTHIEQLHVGIPHASLVVLEQTEHNIDRDTADGERSRAAVSHSLADLPMEN